MLSERLRQLLEHLERILDPERQVRIEDLYCRALTWEPVARLPLIMDYPLPEDLPFQP